MKKKLFISFFLLLASCSFSFAQTEQDSIKQDMPSPVRMKIGFLSFDEALKAMPEYSVVQASLNSLRDQYDTEMQNAEKDFNEKYELFIDGLPDMVLAIREKRQSELQSMMERNIAFRQEAARLIEQAEADALAPLYVKLNNVISDIAEERAYIMVVNTDSNACPYLNPTMAEDITTLVIDRCK